MASNARPRRPVVVLLTSHWLSLLGTVLVTTAGMSWLFVLPVYMRGHVSNPYIGILVFLLIPAVFFAGLAVIPAGVFLAKRRIRRGLETIAVDPRVALRRLALFVGVTTVANVVIGSQLTYRAVGYMETDQFCGGSCHVMLPEYTAYQVSPHARVECVECHVGTGFSGWVESKLAGTRQMIEVLLDSYPRPVPSAMESGKLVPARETCEHCHWPEKFAPIRLRVVIRHDADEANTERASVLMMLLGGRGARGIHASHFGAGVRIRYAAADAKRQTIPWVEYRDGADAGPRVYRGKGTPDDSVRTLPVHEMQCVDCHNRPTHVFELPDRAVDKAMVLGEIPASLPFVKRKGVEILQTEYASREEAAHRIPAELEAFYRGSYPALLGQRSGEVARAAAALLAIWERNVFPDLKVTWGTYPNNLGHTDFPGCFRCHDDEHAAADGKTISQDCNGCHEPLAIEETSPKILESLGLAKRIAALKAGP